MENIFAAAALVGALALGGVGVGCVFGTDSCLWPVPTFLGGGLKGWEEADEKSSAGLGWAFVVVSCGMLLPALAVVACRKLGSKSSLQLLYVQRFLTAWGDRMWQMAVPILFIDMFQDTLLPTSLYVMIVYIAVVQFLPRLGSWLDNSSRLRVQRICLGVENTCVVSSCIIICTVTANASFALSDSDRHSLSDWQTIIWFSLLVLLGCVGELFNNTLVVSMEKDWVVVISEQSGTSLSTINTWMRRIDLLCKAVSPIIFTLLYQLQGDRTQRRIFYGSITVGLWNFMSWPLEMVMVKRIFNEFSSLALKVHEHEDGTRHSHTIGHQRHYHLADSDEEDNSKMLLSRWIVPQDAILDESEINPKLCVEAVDSPKEKNSQESFQPSFIELVLPDNPAPEENGNRNSEEGDFHSHGHSHSHDHSHDHSHSVSENRRSSIRRENLENRTNTWLKRAIESNADRVRLLDGYSLIGTSVKTKSQCSLCTSFVESFRAYWVQPVFLASFAYTMLYMTVLDNGALMTSYLEWSGVDPVLYGAGRGAGAVMGLFGTFLYPLFVSKICGTVGKTGLVSIWLFILNLAPVGVFVFLNSSAGNTALEYAMIICVAVSRIWLWIFDLAITELVQMTVPENQRGLVGAAQTASYQIFFILVHLAAVFSPDPRNFSWLVLASTFIVLVASILYTVWYMRAQEKKTVLL